jgi:hypothetical protein
MSLEIRIRKLPRSERGGDLAERIAVGPRRPEKMF